MAKENPFKKKDTPSVLKAAEIPKTSKVALVEEMLKEVQESDNKGKIHRTTLEIPAEIYAQIEEIRAETELTLKGFFMIAAKKYIADYQAKKNS